MSYLESGLKKLSNKFEQDLINKLNSKGHNKTGKLEKSIHFSFNESGGDYTIELSCLEYIKYLDDGKFLDDFLKDKREELAKELPILIKKDIMDELEKL